MAVEFRLLGPVEVYASGRAVTLGPARHRGVLAALLCDANRFVSVDALVDRVWGGSPIPKRPRSAVHTYISLLKRSLADVACTSIVRQSQGYSIELDEALLDLHRFRALVAKARGGGTGAVTLFERAFGLWRGQALAALESPWAESTRRALDAERLTAESDLTDLQLTLGRHATVLAMLAERCAASPLDERLAGQLILALFRSGRQADALRHYHRVRRQLVDELGTEPGHPLQRLYQQVLKDDPALAAPVPGPVPVPGPAPASAPVSLDSRGPGSASTPISGPEGRPPGEPVAPRQLPAGIRAFVGRRVQLRHLDALLDDTRECGSGNGVIAAVSGPGGIGKSALAVHWAHRVADRFPDGQFYANLRGFDAPGQALRPGEVIRDFLEAMGLSHARIPVTLDARAALFRSMLAGKRMLIVLDNARDADQVRPLLPGCSTGFTLVTSRNQLTSLIATDGAQPVGVDLLTRDEARELLARRLGDGPIAAHPGTVGEIITACAGLPLALTIVAARAEQTGFPLDALAAELNSACHRLDALDGGDPASQLRAVLASSYATLSPAAARMFRLLARGPGNEISAGGMASVGALSLRETRGLLGELTRASLLVERSPGQYACHDLLLIYAKELRDARGGDTHDRCGGHDGYDDGYDGGGDDGRDEGRRRGGDPIRSAECRSVGRAFSPGQIRRAARPLSGGVGARFSGFDCRPDLGAGRQIEVGECCRGDIGGDG